MDTEAQTEFVIACYFMLQ